MQRPWDGQTESVHSDMGLEFDPTNPLCPGVVRSSGIVSILICNTLLVICDVLINNDFR